MYVCHSNPHTNPAHSHYRGKKRERGNNKQFLAGSRTRGSEEQDGSLANHTDQRNSKSYANYSSSGSNVSSSRPPRPGSRDSKTPAQELLARLQDRPPGTML